MPELTDMIPWQNVKWDNMDQNWSSGAGHLDERPYYFRVVGSGKQAKVLIISAVPSQKQDNALHATDYLRLGRNGFKKLLEVGSEVFEK